MSKGKITQIIGAVVDVKFDGELPEILESVLSSGKLEEDTEKSLVETIMELKKNFNS